MIKIYVMDIAPLKNRELCGLAYSKLSEERRRRADRIKREDERIRSVGASLLLEYALGKRGVSEFVYSYGKHGKPRLSGREDIRFNISHSGDRVMCALSDTPVGCDVERISEVRSGIEKRVLTDDEADFCDRAENREATFFRFWTAKESFIKAVGGGMSIPLTESEVRLWESREGISPIVSSSCGGKKYYVKEYFLSDGYCYACASAEGDFPTEIRVSDLEKIMEAK